MANKPAPTTHYEPNFGSEMTPWIAAHLAYTLAADGLSVFPVGLSRSADGHSIAKRPLTKRGHLDALRVSHSDEFGGFGPMVYDAFERGCTWLRENEYLGVGCYVGDAGYLVLDLDTHNPAKDGVELASELGFRSNVVTFTPSGGQHLFFAKRDKSFAVGNAVPKEWQGYLDIRGDAGWVVAPGTTTPIGDWIISTEQQRWEAPDLCPVELWERLSPPAVRTDSGSIILAPAERADADRKPCGFVATLALTLREELRLCQNGGRHEAMIRALVRLASSLAEGHHGISAVKNAYRMEWLKIVNDPGRAIEFDRAWSGALDYVSAEQYGLYHGDPCVAGGSFDLSGVGVAAPVLESGSVPTLVEPTDSAFWSAHPLLEWCNQAGLVAVAPREALLGAALARCAAEISPTFVVESPMGIGYSSLNIMTMIVGGSGSGKTTAQAIVDSSYPWYTLADAPLSGEGLVKAFLRKPSKDEMDSENPPRLLQGTGYTQAHWARLAIIDEFQTLHEARNRGGNTISGIMRSMWNGGAVALTYSGDGKSLYLEPYQYRWCASVGVQPSFAPQLFSGEDAGDTQRYLWFNAGLGIVADSIDIDAMDTKPPRLDAFINLDRWRNGVAEPGAWTASGRRAHKTIPVAAEVKREIRVHQVEVMRTANGDPEAHVTQVRLRVAALLALTVDRDSVTVDDWVLAGLITGLSSRRREQQRDSMNAQSIARAESQGKMDAVREEAGERHKTDKLARGLVKLIVRHRDSGKCPDGCSRGCLVRYAGRNTEFVDEAISLAVTRGLVVESQREAHGSKTGQSVSAWTALWDR